MTDGEGSGADADDQEVTDECAMLIHADHMHKHIHSKSGQEKPSGIEKYCTCIDTLMPLIIYFVTDKYISAAQYLFRYNDACDGKAIVPRAMHAACKS